MSYRYNHVTLVGRLTKDPESQQVTKERSKTYFTLAVNRAYKKDDGTSETDFIPIVMWGKLADLSLQILEKGKPALVWGQLQIQSYEKDNKTHHKTEIVGDGFQLLDKLPTK